VNLDRWDELAGIHVRSEFYEAEKFKQGTLTSSLDPTIVSEMASFVDFKGKSILHLQCHFGMDTLSWLRLGAGSVVGVDYSSSAVEAARQLAADIGYGEQKDKCRFVCHDVLTLQDCAELADEKFDIVITNEGVLLWLSDINQWGRVVAHFMKPRTGTFYIFEYHPFAGVFDEDDEADSLELTYPYFPDEKNTPLEHDSPMTYTGQEVKHRTEFVWIYTLGDILCSLLAAGLDLKFVHEFAFSTYAQLSGMEIREDGRYYFKNDEMRRSVPLMFSLLATKRIE